MEGVKKVVVIRVEGESVSVSVTTWKQVINK